jgi:hypothetical protein
MCRCFVLVDRGWYGGRCDCIFFIVFLIRCCFGEQAAGGTEVPSPLGSETVEHVGLLPGHEELLDCWVTTTH